MKIDLLYLAKGRDEFTAASFHALLANTNWALVSTLWIFSDGGSIASAFSCGLPSKAGFDENSYGGPVAIMKRYLSMPAEPQVFAKIDNDVIVPPGWLDACAPAMDRNPGLDLLGIEPPISRTPAPWANGKRAPAPEENYAQGLSTDMLRRGYGVPSLGYVHCDMIGGIGLMRRSAFAKGAPMVPHGPNGVGGFSDWQARTSSVTKGWIMPPLNVFLLDRLPVEPWASLSKRYIAEGLQRPWTNYAPEDHALWDWWLR